MATSKLNESSGQVPVAIIGMACKFPGADGLRAFWRMIRRGEDGISEVPATHWSAADYFDADPKRADMTYCKRGGFLGTTAFDPTEFGIPPTILEATDTSQLLGLVVAKAALEDAGYGEGREFDRDRVGVILGVTGTQELVIPLGARLGHPIWRRALAEAGVSAEVAERVVAGIADGYVGWQENSFPGLLGNVVAGRIANRLNLRGTNCVVDAACASSLAAIHLASMELGTGRCDMALAGGVDALNDIFMHMCFSKTPALSPTGDARPFSAEADGTVLGEGIGIVVLKRLADAERDGDRVYAVIRSIGTSSDGRSQSIYAPHAAGQARALRNAYKLAGIGAEEVELIEGHGTGTKVGDATEFEALRTVFREARGEGSWCALGSVKSQIGHTKAAAGAAGVLKAALAIHHRVLPPTIKADSPNPAMGVESSPFYLSTQTRPWMARGGKARRAGVSSFGFGGSNYHLVLEEHAAALAEAGWDGSVQILAVSGRTREELIGKLGEMTAGLRGAEEGKAGASPCRRGEEGKAGALPYQELGEGKAGASPYREGALAYQAACSRQGFRSSDEMRLTITAEGCDEALARMEAARGLLEAGAVVGASKAAGVYFGEGSAEGRLAVLFPGQGSQYVGMGLELACVFPEFVGSFTEAEDGAERDSRLAELVYPRPASGEGERARQEKELSRTEHAQPALGAVELGMWRVMERFGVRGDCFAGHSFGELTALAAAGRIEAGSFHGLARLRGRLMAEGDGGRGAMLAVSAPLEAIARMIEEEGLDVVLANRNSPSQGVLSGAREEIARAGSVCAARGYAARGLSASGAFHSKLVEGALGPFRQALEATAISAGRAVVYSNSTGGAYSEDGAEARGMLARHLVSPVDFVREVEALHDAGVRTFVEVGPKGVLTKLVGAILRGRLHAAMAMDGSGGNGRGLADLARVLARLGAMGHEVDLTKWERAAVEPRSPRMVIPLCGANYRARMKSELRIANSELKKGENSECGMANSELRTAEEGRAGALPYRLGREGESGSSLVSAKQGDEGEMVRMVEGSDRGRGEDESQVDLRNATHREEARARVEGGEGRAAEGTPGLGRGSGRPIEGVMAEGLRAMQALQRQTAEAHVKFLEAQERAHRAIEALLMGSGGNSECRIANSELKTNGELARANSELTTAQAEQPAVEGGDVGERERAEEEVGFSGTEAGAGMESAGDAALREILIEVVCEKTGYPREMIALEMDLEADLGVDSIKRVEIVAGIEERLPGWGEVRPEHVGAIRTLGDILAYANGQGTGGAAKGAEAGGGAGRSGRVIGKVAGVLVPCVGHSEGSAGAGMEQFEGTLLDVVAELTGYPREMLGLEMDLEADLGIDSIKRVEILAAMEGRCPGLPAVRPELMGSMRSLRDVAGYYAGAVGGNSECRIANSERGTEERGSRVGRSIGPGESKYASVSEVGVREVVKRIEPVRSVERAGNGDGGGLSRQVLGMVELGAGEASAEGGLFREVGCEIWVTEEGGELSRAIVRRLGAMGKAARLIAMNVAMGEAREEAKAAGGGKLGGLIVVGPDVRQPDVERPGEAGAGGVPWHVLSEAWVKRVFGCVQGWGGALRRGGGGGFLASVARMDGAFGLAGGEFDPVQGALAGLVKTAGMEWPEVRCRAIDVALEWTDADAAAGAVVAELGRDGPMEVGLDRGARRGLELRRAVAAEGSPALGAGDVVVATGGARGVTAAAAAAVGKAFTPTMVILGRSALAGHEPRWLVGLEGEAAIKRAILANEFGGRERPSPAELEAIYRRRVADREVRRNLDRLERTGARVVYRAVDVRDGAAVRVVMEDVRRRFGPIRGIIHGAGVLEDRRIEDKTEAQFAAVFDTKVAGLRAMLSAVDLAELRSVVLFSSVSARFGNVGQVDYAMANEVLNKAGQRLARALPNCRVRAINWGPWDGGMVQGGLKRAFEQRGVGLIPMEAGAAALVDELSGTGRGGVEVVIGSRLAGMGEDGSGKSEVGSRKWEDGDEREEDRRRDDAVMALSFERRVDLGGHPFLRSHVIGGRAVLPVAMMMEWMGQAAMHGHPGLGWQGLDELRVLRAIAIPEEGRSLRFFAGALRREADGFAVEVEIRSGAAGAGSEASCARAMVRLGDRLCRAEMPGGNAEKSKSRKVEIEGLAGEGYSRAVAEAYEDVLFHGEMMRVIEAVEGVSEQGIVVRIRGTAAPMEWMSEPMRSDWLAEPGAIDGGLQAAILWGHERMGMLSLPMRVERYRQYGVFDRDGVRAAVEVVRRGKREFVVDVRFVDGAGAMVASMEGVGMISDESLAAAFGRGGGALSAGPSQAGAAGRASLK